MRFLKKLLPSYRAANMLNKRIKDISIRLNSIERQIGSLDNKNDYLFYCLQSIQGESIEETKRRIFLNMPKAEGDLRIVQQGSDYILKRLKKICSENGIEFFLEGGTLIGAERHHSRISTAGTLRGACLLWTGQDRPSCGLRLEDVFICSMERFMQVA